MNEAYSAVAYGLRVIGLPANTFLVEHFLNNNDFEGLIALLEDAKERCRISKDQHMRFRLAAHV